MKDGICAEAKVCYTEKFPFIYAIASGYNFETVHYEIALYLQQLGFNKRHPESQIDMKIFDNPESSNYKEIQRLKKRYPIEFSDRIDISLIKEQVREMYKDVLISRKECRELAMISKNKIIGRPRNPQITITELLRVEGRNKNEQLTVVEGGKKLVFTRYSLSLKANMFADCDSLLHTHFKGRGWPSCTDVLLHRLGHVDFVAALYNDNFYLTPYRGDSPLRDVEDAPADPVFQFHCDGQIYSGQLILPVEEFPDS